MVGVVVMQTYGRQALEDKLDVGETVLDRWSTWASSFQLPAKEADPQFAIGPSNGRGVWWSLLLGFAWFIPLMTNCERAWHGPELPFYHHVLSALE